MTSQRLATLLVVLLVTSPVLAQDTAVLFGRVRTADGRPVARLELTVVGPSGSLRVVTDRRGEYRVGDLAPGEYAVVPTQPGLVDGPSHITLSAGIARVLDITLAGPGGPETSPPGDSPPSSGASPQGVPDARPRGGEVRGTVHAVDGAVLPGATVSVDGTTIVTHTDGFGRYVIRGLSPGSMITVRAWLSGFAEGTARALVVDGETIVRDFTLDVAQISEVITVETEIPLLRASDEIGRLELSPVQIAALPSLGEKDIFRAFQLLPGISGSHETSSGLYVRGGTPDQNLIWYDGFTLYDVDHLFGYFTAFNMEAVEKVQVSKGAFDARYGGRLSSVVELVGKSGDTEERRGSLGASLLSVNGLLEQPLPGDGSLLLAARRSFQGPLYDKILGLFDDNQGGPAQARGRGPGGGFAAFSTQPSSYFYDVNAKLSFQPTDRSRFAISFYDGQDDLDNSRDLQLPSFMLERLAERGIEVEGDLAISDRSEWGNRGVAGLWSRTWSDSFQSRVSLGYSRYFSDRDRSASSSTFRPMLRPDDEGDTDAPQPRANRRGGIEDNQLEDVTLRWDNTLRLLWNNHLEFGASLTSNDVRYGYDLDSSDAEADESETTDSGGLLAVLDRAQTGTQSSFYVQDRWTLFERLTLVPGLRVARFDLTDETFLEPRASATIHVTDGLKLKGAWGRHHQFASRVTREDVMQGSREFWTLADGEIVPTAASEHLVAGVSYETRDFLASVEAYHTDLTGLSEFALRFRPSVQESDVDFNQFFYTGAGTSRGVELLVQKKLGDHTGWISYTLGQVEHAFPELEEEPFPALHDQRHELKLVDSLRLGDWTFSGTWVYATGKPYTEPIGVEQVTLPMGWTVDQVVVGTKNGGRLPPYHRLDLSAHFDLDLDWAQATIGVSLFNVYDRTNVWYKEFETVEGEILANDIELMGRTANVFLNVRF